MKKLQPFFKAYWQTAIPFYIAITILEFIKPGIVHSRVHMTTFFVTIVFVFILDVFIIKNSTTRE